MSKERIVKFEGQNLSIWLETEADESVYEEIFVDRDYRVLDQYLKKADFVLDIGAHIGLFALYAMVLGAKQVWSYEPEERNFALLKKHLKENRIKGVNPKNLAIVGGDDKKQFYVNEDSHNHSFFAEGEAKNVNQMQVGRLFDKFEHCDVLKMDCEGMEFEIIEAMDQKQFSKVSTIYIEYHEFRNGFEAAKLELILRKHYKKVQIFPSRYDKRMGFVIATNIT